jgi:hypothetical protein
MDMICVACWTGVLVKSASAREDTRVDKAGAKGIFGLDPADFDREGCDSRSCPDFDEAIGDSGKGIPEADCDVVVRSRSVML